MRIGTRRTPARQWPRLLTATARRRSEHGWRHAPSEARTSHSPTWHRHSILQSARIRIAQPSGHRSGDRCNATALTTGLKCAPLIGPKTAIRVASTATVANVLASSATAPLPAASLSAMMPEPMTQAASSSAPSASAATLRHMFKRLASVGRNFPMSCKLLLQLHAVQRTDGQAGENLDATFEFVKGLAKRQPLLRLRTMRRQPGLRRPNARSSVARARRDTFRLPRCRRP